MSEMPGIYRECGATYGPSLAYAMCTLPAGHEGNHEDHSGAEEFGEILAWAEASDTHCGHDACYGRKVCVYA